MSLVSDGAHANNGKHERHDAAINPAVEAQNVLANSASTQHIVPAELIAQQVLLTVFETEDIDVPVDIDAVLKHEQITLKIGSFTTPGVMGAYDRQKRNIFAHKAASIERKTFTVAHELGHHFLHKEKQKDVMWRQTFQQIGHEERGLEREANRFAAALLMPEHLVREVWDGLMRKDVVTMARTFGVSNTAMRYRLQQLGLIAAFVQK